MFRFIVVPSTSRFRTETAIPGNSAMTAKIIASRRRRKISSAITPAGTSAIPTYRVSGELKDKADLALQGEVLNEIEDIDKAALDLVVGVPNFRFKDTAFPTPAAPSSGMSEPDPVLYTFMVKRLGRTRYDLLDKRHWEHEKKDRKKQIIVYRKLLLDDFQIRG